MMRKRLDFLEDEHGLSSVEYILILVLIAIVGLGAWKVFGGRIVHSVRASTTQVNSL